MIRSCKILLVTAMAWQCCAATLYADKLWLAPPQVSENFGSGNRDLSWYARPIQKIDAEILRWDRDVITVKIAGGNDQQSYRADRVVHVHPEPVAAPEQTWLGAMVANDDTKIIRSLSPAIQSRPPTWRQQWYTVWTTHSVAKTGRMSIVYNLVAQLDNQPLPPVMIARLPVAWSGVPLSSDTSPDDHAALNHSSPAVRLVAASRLMRTDPGEADETMASLSNSPTRPSIASVATILKQIHGSGANVGSHWRDHLADIRRMPIVLQDGPLACLLSQCRRHGVANAVEQLTLQQRYTSILRQ